MVLLLVQLEFPRSTTVRLDCTFDEIHDISMLLSPILDRFSYPSSPSLPQSAQTELRYLDLCLFKETWKLAYGTPSCTDAFRGDVLSLAETDLGSQFVSTHVDYGLRPDDFLQWFHVFPLAHINVFALHSYVKWDIDNKSLWAEVFQGASKLHIIGMQYGCIRHLIHALEPHYGMIPVPTLTDIWFSNVQFKPKECQVEGYRQGYLGCLGSALTSCARAGIVLQRLVLSDCKGITEDDVTKLSMVVD